MLDGGVAKLGDFGQARLVGGNMSPYVATRWWAPAAACLPAFVDGASFACA